jgi:hypothetical protein
MRHELDHVYAVVRVKRRGNGTDRTMEDAMALAKNHASVQPILTQGLNAPCFNEGNIAEMRKKTECRVAAAWRARAVREHKAGPGAAGAGGGGGGDGGGGCGGGDGGAAAPWLT